MLDLHVIVSTRIEARCAAMRSSAMASSQCAATWCSALDGCEAELCVRFSKVSWGEMIPNQSRSGWSAPVRVAHTCRSVVSTETGRRHTGDRH
jgi:hypothetical protein